MIRLATLSIMVFFAVMSSASALMMPHVVRFTTTTVDIPSECQSARERGVKTAPCDATVGDLFFGFFTVEDSLLATDGTNRPGTLGDFVIRIGDYVWDMNLASDFSGFRGPPGGLGAASPGFDVVGGEIVNMRGGVYGSGDEPYVDFISSDLWPHRWIFSDGGASFSGNFAILTVVAEPASATLALWWIASLCVAARLPRRPFGNSSSAIT